MLRVLLLLPIASYRNQDFLDAAHKLGVEVISAADHCHQLAPQRGLSPILSLHFDQPEAAAIQVLASLGRRVDAVLAVDDAGVELAAVLREKLDLPGNAPAAVRPTRDKLAFRKLLQHNGLNCPAFHHLASVAEARALAAQLHYPVVVKARRLSASRGVIRADNAQDFLQQVRRVNQIQTSADRDASELGLIVESFIPGSEHALEGLLENGQLRVLALFDKPDPLDGPYFEESIYVTPSRLSDELQAAIADTVQRACAAAALNHGAIHAEMRVNNAGVWLLEIAARSIGGLCGRMLRWRLGMTLEELILRHALNLPIAQTENNDASGVMMIPVPQRGIYQSATGLEAARAVPHIEDIRITTVPGQRIAPAPEGASYLGFIFSRATTPAAAEAALRAAHAELVFDIQPDLALTKNTA
ncbi:MAG: ATP-grasp domain-containing protein [Pseudomonadota bacterium]